jgi:HSP20 family protein
MNKEKSMSKISRIFGEQPQPDAGKKPEEWLSEFEGQLAIDAYQTPSAVKIKAPIAGVRPEDLQVSVTDDTVTIRGERKAEKEADEEGYFCQECYWGAFSRSFTLPKGIDSEKASAKLKNGILEISIPKHPQSNTRQIRVITEE